jgi:Zn-finger nucleic acid-binding protein
MPQTSSSICNCPECGEPLFWIPLGEDGFDRCEKCGGIWLKRDTLEKLSIDQQMRHLFLDVISPECQKQPITIENVRYRPCPECKKLMTRSNFGRVSGVILDMCQSHGSWFDRGELHDTLTFIDIGGLERQRERQELDQWERQRMEIVNQPLPTSTSNECPGSFLRVN